MIRKGKQEVKVSVRENGVQLAITDQEAHVWPPTSSLCISYSFIEIECTYPSWFLSATLPRAQCNHFSSSAAIHGLLKLNNPVMC